MYQHTTVVRDAHNPRKGHHIKIKEDGTIWYNQVIEYGPDKDHLQGFWSGDLYTDQQMDSSHGYWRYAMAVLGKQLVCGSVFDYWFNQKDREVEILCTSKGAALGIY
jgi:hypothetical protein